MSERTKHMWSLAKGFYSLISPVQSFTELEGPFLFLASLLTNIRTWDTRQQQIILGITIPLLSYHFCSNYRLKRQQPINRLDIHDPVQRYFPDESQSIAEQIEAYETDPSISVELGLSPLQVKERRAQYGLNETWTEPTWSDWLRLLAGCCTGSHILLLEGSTVLALYLRRYFPAAGFMTFIMLNVGISMWQNYEMNNVHRSLCGDLKGYNRGFRDGKLTEIPLCELLPGDLLHLKQGETLGADANVVYYSSQITMDQSAITGENLGVKKGQGDICYYSTGCVEGEAYLVVNDIACDTFIGRTMVIVGQPIAGKQHLTECQVSQNLREHRAVLRSIGIVLLVMVASVFIGLAFFSQRLQQTEDRICFGLSMMMCIIPVYLYSVMNTIRTNGLVELSESKIILQTEIHGTMGLDILSGIDVVITDKTGTLTQNDLRTGIPFCLDCEAEELAFSAALCVAGKDSENHGPIEAAFTRALEKYPDALSRWNDSEITDFEPFNPETKVTISVVKDATGQTTRYVKGATKATLQMCTVSSENTERYQDACIDFANRGLRCLGIARQRENEDEWQLLGLLPLIDPMRDDTPTAVKAAKAIGVNIRMCTGDTSVVAKKVASPLGLDGECITTDVLLDAEDCIDDPEVNADITSASIYAVVFPEHKTKIVQILQKSSLRVAITGDGLNDAPSLRLADFGIAVEGATEAAQSASDVILLKPGLINIVRGIYISRQVFAKLWMVVTCSTILTVHDLCLQVLFLLFTGEVMHPLGTVACFASAHVVSVMLGKFGKPAIATRPARWDITRLWSEVLPLILLFLSGTCLSLTVIRYFKDSEPTRLSRYILSLSTTHNDKSMQTSVLLVFHLLSSRRCLLFIWSVNDRTFARMPYTALGSGVLGFLVGNPWAIASMTLFQMFTLVGGYLIRQAQGYGDGAGSEVVDLDRDLGGDGTKEKKDQ